MVTFLTVNTQVVVPMEVVTPAITTESIQPDSTNIPSTNITTMAGQKSTDEEKLQEYLSQTNTVVIFPEPVSDGDDGDNDDDEDRVNTSQDLGKKFSIKLIRPNKITTCFQLSVDYLS